MFLSKQIVHQILAIFPATLQTIMIGFGCGWVIPTIASFNNSDGDFSLTDDDCAWIASLHFLGRIAGTALASAVVDRIGRVAIVVTVSALEVLVWVGVAVTRAVLLHYAIRLAFGMAVGFLDTVLPVYIGENSSPNVRAAFGTTISLFFFGGEILAFAIGTYASYLPVAVVAVSLALASLPLLLLLQQPAQYLLMRGREERAKIQFQRMRGRGQEVDREFEDMKSRLSSVEAEFSPRALADPRVQIVCWIHALAFLTGFPPINAFLTAILEPVSPFGRDQLVILFGVAQFAGAACATAFVDKFGRRTLWMAAALVCVVAHSATALLRHCLADGIPVPGLRWLLFAAVATYGATYASVILTLVNTARGELLPAKYKAAGVCAAIIVNSMVAFAANHVFAVMAASLGVESAFVFFALGSLWLLVYIYFRLPETKDLTLIEIQKLFEE